MGAWILLLAASVGAVRVENGRVFATVDGEERPIAASAGKAWVAMNGGGVFYTEGDGRVLRYWREASGLVRTVARERAAVRDLMQNLLPDGRWVVVLSLADGSVTALDPERGVLLRRPNARVVTIQQDILVLEQTESRETERIRLTGLRAPDTSGTSSRER